MQKPEKWNARDGEHIEMRRIYVAPPDSHLLIERDLICLSHSPKVNYFRPAIDPLFRSAADTFGSRVIGVVLTGALHDGSAGLLAIKDRGGIGIVQDPREAKAPSMPRNAISIAKVDYILPVGRIGHVLAKLATESCELPELDRPAEYRYMNRARNGSQNVWPIRSGVGMRDKDQKAR